MPERVAVLLVLDDPTRSLILLAAAIAGSGEAEVRRAVADAATAAPAQWIDELMIQSYLFSGFPRALNAAREWRRVAPVPAPASDETDEVSHADEWRERGQATCQAVYGDMYEKLRQNVRELHPALDASMVVDGYGKILGRPALDLPRRELCIVAACAATGQDRQLHSHLRGALNVGVAPSVLQQTVALLAPALGHDRAESARLLLARVLGK